MSGARRAGGALLVGALVAGAGGLGWWAGRATLVSEAPPEQSVAAAPVWAEASEGSVGRSLNYSTTLRQPSLPVAFNGLAGVVTAVHPGEVTAGDPLYAVGDTTVRAVKLGTPMWRDLARGVRGDDVAALQALLKKLGHLEGGGDGVFGARTEAAVKAWQKKEGRAQTGTVARGELVAFERLPVTVSLGKDIAVGRVLAGGEEAVLAPTGAREFVLVLTDDQARQVPAEAAVDITFEDQTWPAAIAGSRQDENGQTMFDLVGADGGEVCADACAALPLDAQVTLRSQVVVVPRVSGVTVPVAAVRTAPDGSTTVMTEAGEVRVEVQGSGQGLAVVEGIDVGTRVLLGQSAPTEAAPSDAPDEEG